MSLQARVCTCCKCYYVDTTLRFSLIYGHCRSVLSFFFFFQAEDGIRDLTVTGVQTCALPISPSPLSRAETHPAPLRRPPQSTAGPRAARIPPPPTRVD